MRKTIRELRQIYKINYRNIVLFELVYRLIFVILYSRIVTSLFDWLLGIYGYSYD